MLRAIDNHGIVLIKHGFNCFITIPLTPNLSPFLGLKSIFFIWKPTMLGSIFVYKPTIFVFFFTGWLLYTRFQAGGKIFWMNEMFCAHPKSTNNRQRPEVYKKIIYWNNQCAYSFLMYLKSKY